MNTLKVLPVSIALVFLMGCSDSGYDLHFVAPQFVETIELTIDLKNGQVPRQVNSKSQLDVYEIDVDAAGKAAINDTWPVSRPHRTFLILPDESLQALYDISITQSDVQLRQERKGNHSWTTVDGTKYIYSLRRKSSDELDNQEKEQAAKRAAK